MTGNFHSWRAHSGLLDDTIKAEKIVKRVLSLLPFQKISEWCLHGTEALTLLPNSEFPQGGYKAFQVRRLPHS